MAYTITLTNGSTFATIPDGTINTSSSMTLVGKNYSGYGQFINDNIIRLLQNGANTTAPGAPLQGQLWYDQTTNTMKVYTGTAFKVISGATASSTAPSVSNVAGDLWYDTVNAQLNVYTGSAWILVGPAYTGGTGVTGAIVATITDTNAVSHVAVEMYVADAVVGIFSKDAAYTPIAGDTPAGGGWTGGKQVQPGLTMSGPISGVTPLFQGTANNANFLGGIASSGFVATTNNQTMSGTLGILNNTGLSVGAAQDFKASVTGSDVFLRNATAAGNLTIQVQYAGSTTDAIRINGANAMTTIPNSLTVNTAGGATAIVNGGGNGVGNIGSQASYFNRVFAQATTALYADVAERFASDEIYEPGTVVELGGSAEITRVLLDASDKVFGVISTRPAFTMNGGAGDDDTHPPVAITGRVPVMVTGVINRGDRLISAGDGMARAALAGEATAFNVIGRALSEKTTTGVGTVEAIVTIK
jgi:hypothetical protein